MQILPLNEKSRGKVAKNFSGFTGMNEWGLQDYWRHTHRSAGRTDQKAHPLTGSQKRNSLSSQPNPTKLKEQSQPLCPEQSSMERRTQKGMRQSPPREKRKEKQAEPESHNAKEKESRKRPGMNTITRTTRWKQRKAKKPKERRPPSSISKILATDEGLDEMHTVHERAQATSGRTEDKPRRQEKGRGGQSKV